MSPLPAALAHLADRPRIRRLLAFSLLAAFYALPWVSIHGRPALMLDLAAREAFILGLRLPTQALPGLLCLAAAALALLYLVTNLGGRLWCGLACPQSILGQLYLQLQRCGKHCGNLLWALLAIWTGISFVGYFTPISPLLSLHSSGWSAWTLFWASFYGLATWANIRFLRTRLCRELCPFARLQPWIEDAHTPHVRYQPCRGEPRGPRAAGLPGIHARGRALLDPDTARDYVLRAANPAIAGSWPRFADNRLGDCLDCGQCQQHCPMQLDIRNGVDANCLDCGRCINACDQALASHGLPPGLIQRQAASPLASASRWQNLRHRPRTLLALAIMLISLLCACALLRS